MERQPKRVIVIGAGIAGLTAAKQLTAHGLRVTVLDKGRNVGGRMATRHFDHAVCDHGAQFFTARSSEFQAAVDEMLAQGTVVEWARGFVNPSKPSSGQHPRYRGANAMTHPLRAIADTLPDVRTSHTVRRIETTDGAWRVEGHVNPSRESFVAEADALIMTPPAEQSLALFDASKLTLPVDVRQALEAITFYPCFTVLALLDRASPLPEPGAIQLDGDPLAWIADNQKKGISPVPALTIHAGGVYSRQHFDDPRDEVAARLIAAARPYLGGAHVQSYQIHRWRYSQAETVHDAPTLTSIAPAPLAFAGDAFGQPRVEGAFLSGHAAANAIQSML